jgi:tight adherence protein B
MNPGLSLVFLLITVAGATVAVGLAVFFFQRYANPEPSPIRQRLANLKERQGDEDSLLIEQSQRLARFYKEKEYQNEELGKQFEKLNFFLHLKQAMQQAGIKTPADRFFITNILIPIGLFAFGGVLTGFFVMILAGPLFAGIAYASVLWKRQQRLNQLVTQLPDALALITSSLRAGHSFQSAMATVSTDLPDPLAGEFANVVRDMNLGVPVKEALDRMVNKLNNLPDLCMFSTAVLIQREAGGNLAEVLDNLGYTIRERFKLKGQISALTGQSRLTGYVLGGAPALLLVGLSIFMYGYVKPLWETELGHAALVVVVVLQSLGFFIMRRIIDIRV